MYTVFCLHVCMPAGLKRVLDLIIDGQEPQCGCWELNSGLLAEQLVFLPSEPALHMSFYCVFLIILTMILPQILQQFSVVVVVVVVVVRFIALFCF